jgi:hypothetical protein
MLMKVFILVVLFAGLMVCITGLFEHFERPMADNMSPDSQCKIHGFWCDLSGRCGGCENAEPK